MCLGKLLDVSLTFIPNMYRCLNDCKKKHLIDLKVLVSCSHWSETFSFGQKIIYLISIIVTNASCDCLVHCVTRTVNTCVCIILIFCSLTTCFLHINFTSKFERITLKQRHQLGMEFCLKQWNSTSDLNLCIYVYEILNQLKIFIKYT